MKNTFHGIASLLLFMTACLIALAVVLQYSMAAALIYGGVLVLGPIAIVGFYCTKCPCRLTNCGHYFPGRLTRFFPKRKPGKYSGFELSIVLITVLAIVGIPQYWLWNSSILFAVFWTCIAIAMVQINRFVCTSCENAFCIANKKHSNESGEKLK